MVFCRNTLYHFRNVKIGAAAAPVHRATLDGIEQPDHRICLSDDGREHPVTVELGDSPQVGLCPIEHPVWVD